MTIVSFAEGDAKGCSL